MTSTADKCNADSSSQEQSGPAALPRYGYQRLIIVCITGGVLANAAWVLGAYELLGPKATYFALLATLGVAVVWPVAMLLAIRKSTRMAYWIGIVVVSIPWFGGALIALLLLVAGFFSTCGYCGSTASQDPITWGLSSALVLAVAWTFVILLATRRRASWINRIAFVVGTVVCWGGPILATVIFVLIPTVKINPVDLEDQDKLLWCIKPENAAEVRSICHRALVWDSDPHDVFIDMSRWGDESSVPYLLWSLRWMPSEKIRSCTWGHGLDALRRITNHDAGETRQAWAKWYAANKGRSQESP